MFPRYFKTHAEVFDSLDVFTKAQGELSVQFRLRCVATKLDPMGIVNCLTIIQGFQKGEEPPVVSGRTFPHFMCLEESHSLESLRKILSRLSTGNAQIAGTSVTFTSGFRETVQLPSLNQYGIRAGLLASGISSGYLSLPHEPLVAPDQPFFPNGHEAMQEWLELPQLTIEQAQGGRVLVYLPECRVGIQALTRVGNQLQVRSWLRKSEMTSDLAIKGAWSVNGTTRRFDRPFSEEIVLEIEEDAREFEVYVVGRDGTVYDFHDERHHRGQGRPRVLPTTKEGTLEDVVQRALTQCEGAGVEFKPFIKEGDHKLSELLETTIAFANTRGGVVVLGIDKRSIVEGVEQAASAQARKENCNVDDFLLRYQGVLRRYLNDHLNRTPPITIDALTFKGHRLIVIQVEQGLEPPYANREGNHIYVRRGANNVRPDPDTELRALMNPKTPSAIIEFPPQ